MPDARPTFFPSARSSETTASNLLIYSELEQIASGYMTTEPLLHRWFYSGQRPKHFCFVGVRKYCVWLNQGAQFCPHVALLVMLICISVSQQYAKTVFRSTPPISKCCFWLTLEACWQSSANPCSKSLRFLLVVETITMRSWHGL